MRSFEDHNIDRSVMRMLKPYHRLPDLKRLLDNGGRFWHLLCKAGDGRVTRGELEAASGWSADKVAPYVYLAMKMIEMPEDSQNAVLSQLSPLLRERYESWRPHLLDPSEVEMQGAEVHSVIISGYVRDVQDSGAVIGDVRWAYLAGNRMPQPSIVEVPIRRVYRTFTLHDTRERQLPSTAMGFRGKSSLPCDRRIRFGGVLVELKRNVDNVRTHAFLFRPLYYTIVADDMW